MAYFPGTSGADSLVGGTADDQLEGFGGNDTMRGGGGDDTFYLRGTDIGRDLHDGGDGSDRISLGAGFTASSLLLTSANLISIEYVDFPSSGIGGTGGRDVFNISGITATSGYQSTSDTIYMRDGNDDFTGYRGNDYVDGGAGADVLRGNAGSDYFTGGSGNDWLIGGSGNDVFSIGGNDFGQDFMDGGNGLDRIRLTSDIAVSRLWLTSNNMISVEMLDFLHSDIRGTGGKDVFNISGITSTASYETIHMLDGADDFYGYAGNDYVDGGAGNDTLVGDAGDDHLTGGSGNDSLVGGSGDDVFSIGGKGFGQDIYDGGSGGDRILLTSDVTTRVLNLSGTQMLEVEALDFASYSIQGTAAADDFDISAVEVTVNASTIYLHDGSDLYRGRGGADMVDAGAGNDWLSGGRGDDLLTGGTGRDTTDYGRAWSGVTVDLGLTTAQNIGGGQGRDTLNSIEIVIGSSKNDMLTGNGSANDLLAGSGSDVLDGGRGNDLLNGGTGQDRASYATASSGVAVRLTLTTAQDVGGGQGLDRLISVENLTGSRFADRLQGNGGNNLLDGGSGHDRLLGGLGNDRLIGRADNDRLTGHGGADVFQFDTNDGTDRILDWQDESDAILLRRGSWQGDRYDDFGDLSIHQSGANVLVTFGGTVIVVEDTRADSMSAADFDFV